MPEDYSTDELSRELARNLTAEIAPQESQFFDELVDAYSRPKPAIKDRSLAFGISPEGVIAVALVEVGKAIIQEIWEAAKPMLKDLLQEGTADVRAEIGQKLKTWIDSRFKTPLPIKLEQESVQKIVAAAEQAATLQGLTQTQIAEIGKMVTNAVRGGD